MKYLFWALLFLTVMAFASLRIHQHRFEAETGLSFDVMAFELPGSVEHLNELIHEWSDPNAKQFVLMQLKIDYFFMSTLFPWIAVMCLWAKEKWSRISEKTEKSKGISFICNLMLILACLQGVAWSFDLIENIRLSGWLRQGYAENIFAFEWMVRAKFLFAFAGIVFGLAYLLLAQWKTQAIQSK